MEGQEDVNSDFDLVADHPDHRLRRRYSAGSRHEAATPDFGQPPLAPSVLNEATKSQESATPGPLDIDTCRICRAEGTPDEPLFYPCKCSGSIKYVHQNCLMEWLSHSQKKHCELCKTSFRFTKLYSPDMPHNLPILIFVSHVTKYILGSLLVWLRALLVAFVWLAWLPYAMRVVWSLFFSISDFGFSGTGGTVFGFMPNPPHDDIAVGAGYSSTDAAMYSVDQTCMVLKPFSLPMCAINGRYDGSPAQTDFYGLNFTGTDPSFLAYIKFLLVSAGLMEWDGSSRLQYHNHSAPEHISLLSEVNFLRNLTRNNLFNNTIISILEGQIITILVVICFILIILVRDYVVQQQPEIMRAAFPAIVDNPPQPLPEEPQRPIQNGNPRDATRNAEILREGDDELAPEAGPADGRRARVNDIEARLERLDALDERLETFLELRGSRVEPQVPHSHDEVNSSNEGEEPSFQAGTATVGEFLRIYREANGDQERILELIRNEGLEEKLAYWVQLTRAITQRERSGTAFSHAENKNSRSATRSPDDQISILAENQGSPNPEGAIETTDETFKNIGGAWDWPDDMGDVSSLDSPRLQDKGKAVAADEIDEQLHSSNSGEGQAPSISAEETLQQRNLLNFSTEFNFNTAPPRHNVEDEAPISQHVSCSNTNAPLDDMDIPRRNGSVVDTEEFDQALHQEETAQEHEIGLERDETDGSHENDGLVALGAETPVGPRRQQRGLLNRMADFMWGPVEALPNQDNLPDADPAGLANPHIDNHGLDLDDDLDMDLDEAAMEQEAIEDAEDFDGLMELFGMRGPLFGLFQNALFCALLVSVTVFIAVFIPYNVGRVFLLLTAKPIIIVQLVFSAVEFVQDLVLAVVGGFCLALSFSTKLLFTPFNAGAREMSSIVSQSYNLTVDSGGRVLSSIANEVAFAASTEMSDFSSASHAALHAVKDQVNQAASILVAPLVYIFSIDPTSKSEAALLLSATASCVWNTAISLPFTILDPSTWMSEHAMSDPLTTDFRQSISMDWDSFDRFLAIIYGYLSFTLFAAIYLARGRTNVLHPDHAPGWDNALVDTLSQASGVMKVILIISIEMLVFPLYCGLLLDLALMPLFENTTIESRIQFTAMNPATSIFVHWFIGTGYMFHFALFVSMCRKIMRAGVLYFIRDPDDPDFHPVRDVLERNVTTQLRKILFSAFVYGALVLVCLGGVVWGLWVVLPGVLPIHYSSNEPVLEFPIDLLFYNFLMPLAVKSFQPSVGLKAMYTWWFRRCARILRLTWFLFGERQIDEEGTLYLLDNSPHHNLPFWRRSFLGLDLTESEVHPCKWGGFFKIRKTKPYTDLLPDTRHKQQQRKRQLVKTGQLVPDGRFVRSPSSDQVKIPKGMAVFLDVTEENMRLDNRPDDEGVDLYAKKSQYQLVYVPPHFKFRIFLFIFLIWIFAAITGVSFTIIPLLFGRKIFQLFIPSHIRTNDIYAFSIGIYILGIILYSIWHLRTIIRRAKKWAGRQVAGLNREIAFKIFNAVYYSLRLFYCYIHLLVVFPLLVSFFMELYIIIPLHTRMYGLSSHRTTDVAGQSGPFDNENRDGHTIRIVQAWTLGLVYLKLLARTLSSHFEGTRLAASIRAVLREGWLHPNVQVLTRAFVLPAAVISIAGIILPTAGATWFIRWAESGLPAADVSATDTFIESKFTEEERITIYRLSYPCAAILAGGVIMGYRTIALIKSWNTRIRDEAYLVGERLHNFSVQRASAMRVGSDPRRHHGNEPRVA